MQTTFVEIEARHDFNRVASRKAFLDKKEAHFWANKECIRLKEEADKKDPRNADIHSFEPNFSELDVLL